MKLSTSENNTSYTERGRTLLSRDTLYLLSSDWIHFLQDHRSLLQESSTRVDLTEKIMNRYQYRIRDYLKEVHNLSGGLEQAFLVINRLHCDTEFTVDLGYVLVPDPARIRELRRIYSTQLAMIAGIDGLD